MKNWLQAISTIFNERSETIDAVINLNLVTTHICLYLAVTLSQNLTFSGLKNIQIDKRNHTKTYSLLQFRRMRLTHGWFKRFQLRAECVVSSSKTFTDVLEPTGSTCCGNCTSQRLRHVIAPKATVRSFQIRLYSLPIVGLSFSLLMVHDGCVIWCLSEPTFWS